MNDNTIYKTKLIQELTTVTQALRELGVQDINVPSDWIAAPVDTDTTETDESIMADRSEEWQERNGELEALETRYNNLRGALIKIDAGTFGTCEICQTPIEKDRLDANPAARTCKAHMTNETDLPMQ